MRMLISYWVELLSTRVVHVFDFKYHIMKRLRNTLAFHMVKSSQGLHRLLRLDMRHDIELGRARAELGRIPIDSQGRGGQKRIIYLYI